MLNRQERAATALRIEKHSRSRRFIAALTPWRAGLAVDEGDHVQSFGLAWRAQNSGVTGATAPSNESGATSSDGVVTWTHVAVLLTLQPTI
jgi:hypothetical protein